MNDIAGFFPISRLVDAVIVLTFMEAIALVAYYRITGRGVAPRDFLLNMLSGLCLMLALRCAVVDAGWLLIALLLSAAGVAHAADMGQRWVRQRRQL